MKKSDDNKKSTPTTVGVDCIVSYEGLMRLHLQLYNPQ